MEHQHIVEEQLVIHVHGTQVKRPVQRHVADIRHVQMDHVADGHVDHNGHHGELEVQVVDLNPENYINNKRNRNLFLFILIMI